MRRTQPYIRLRVNARGQGKGASDDRTPPSRGDEPPDGATAFAQTSRGARSTLLSGNPSRSRLILFPLRVPFLVSLMFRWDDDFCYLGFVCSIGCLRICFVICWVRNEVSLVCWESDDEKVCRNSKSLLFFHCGKK